MPMASMMASESIRMVRSAWPTGPRGSRMAQLQPVSTSASGAMAQHRSADRGNADVPPCRPARRGRRSEMPICECRLERPPVTDEETAYVVIRSLSAPHRAGPVDVGCHLHGPTHLDCDLLPLVLTVSELSP